MEEVFHAVRKDSLLHICFAVLDVLVTGKYQLINAS
jgi:hypothetical protein